MLRIYQNIWRFVLLTLLLLWLYTVTVKLYDFQAYRTNHALAGFSKMAFLSTGLPNTCSRMAGVLFTAYPRQKT